MLKNPPIPPAPSDEVVIYSSPRSRVIKSTYNGQPCAIKIFMPEAKRDLGVNSDEEEAEILKNCQHENIVTLFEHVKDPQSQFILEYAPHGDFLTFLGQQPVDQSVGPVGPITWSDPEIPCILMEQFLLALRFLHQARYVHRDLKPENLLIFENHKLKLTDFEFAKKVDESGCYLGPLQGTPTYLAPECFRSSMEGKPVSYSAQTDIYAAMIIVYMTFVGLFPFTIKPGEYQEKTNRLAMGYSLVKEGDPKIPYRSLHYLYGQTTSPRENPLMRPSANKALTVLTKVHDEIRALKAKPNPV